MCAILLFYLSAWLFFRFNHAFPTYFTIYSEDFNEESFNKTTIGEHRKVIDSLLGKPIRESIYNHYPDSIMDIYWYTKSKPIGLSYDKIYILFYDDRVVEKIRIVDGD